MPTKTNKSRAIELNQLYGNVTKGWVRHNETMNLKNLLAPPATIAPITCPFIWVPARAWTWLGTTAKKSNDNVKKQDHIYNVMKCKLAMNDFWLNTSLFIYSPNYDLLHYLMTSILLDYSQQHNSHWYHWDRSPKSLHCFCSIPFGYVSHYHIL